MPGRITVVEYDPEWPRFYEEEKELILDAVGEHVKSIEHFGSTSVTGLGAKPIIDIIAGLDSQEIADRCLPALAAVGYDDVTPEPTDDDWYYCLGKGPHSPGVHLHLARHGSPFWKRHLLFRNYLRAHPDTAKEYFELKSRLVEKYADMREAYTESKTDFIENVLENALKGSKS
ncbi:GrpB family protein [Candidatus Bathyarchaeota archaeon]|nr:GrpB family protein [Candidatus Bathyarchaeota archaeon]